MHQTIKISDLGAYYKTPSGRTPNEKEYFLLRMRASDYHHRTTSAFKIDAVVVVICINGTLDMQVNFEQMTLTPHTLTVLNPSNIIELPKEINQDADAVALFLPREFLNQVNLDNSAINYADVRFTHPSTISLNPKQMLILSKHLELLNTNFEANDPASKFTESISRALTGALIYQIMLFAKSGNTVEEGKEHVASHDKAAGRRNRYVEDFMALVARNFHTERSVQFYASKLFITPKHLSMVIKEATGHTATEWIDHFVTLEAKNMLRHSGRNIQQVALALGFNNQSSFGKYFRNQTGMSPSQFRHS